MASDVCCSAIWLVDTAWVGTAQVMMSPFEKMADDRPHTNSEA